MRLSWGAAMAAVAFGAGVLLGETRIQVRGIYRIGKAVGRREGAAQEAARRGLGVPPGPGWPLGSES